MKQLNRFEMAAVKRTAANSKMLVKKLDKIKSQIIELGSSMKDIESQIEAWEKPIMDKWGWTSSQIIEMNGSLPENESTCVAPECDTVCVNE